MKPSPLLPAVAVLLLLLSSCGARAPSESADDAAPVAAEQSATTTTTTLATPQPTTEAGRARDHHDTGVNDRSDRLTEHRRHHIAPDDDTPAIN